ncbi:hypothetical protein [Sorangium sp. So ce341]|uniref:hypothetical protein n=1 Tax=Sorangium sp. So ce341 TaxID=3133302 RepID=UPI003F60D2E9
MQQTDISASEEIAWSALGLDVGESIPEGQSRDVHSSSRLASARSSAGAISGARVCGRGARLGEMTSTLDSPMCLLDSATRGGPLFGTGGPPDDA